MSVPHHARLTLSPLQRLVSLFCLGTVLVTGLVACVAEDDVSAQRAALLADVQADVRMTAGELGFSSLDPAVAQALEKVPRHAFVPPPQRGQAYINYPLPIGRGQTISQPYIVAIMTQLLRVGPGDRVFELGTGSGYQAAVLAQMGVEVYSVEIVPELADRAVGTLRELGYDRVHVRSGDGWLGWPEAAPFDGILVTAAAPKVPDVLVEQLAPGARLVIPLGEPDGVQYLVLLEKRQNGELTRRNLLPVRFVPVTGPLTVP